jgi:hypothetical protein
VIPPGQASSREARRPPGAAASGAARASRAAASPAPLYKRARRRALVLMRSLRVKQRPSPGTATPCGAACAVWNAPFGPWRRPVERLACTFRCRRSVQSFCRAGPQCETRRRARPSRHPSVIPRRPVASFYYSSTCRRPRPPHFSIHLTPSHFVCWEARSPYHQKASSRRRHLR